MNRLTKGQRALVARYKLVSAMLDNYQGSVFYVPDSPRDKVCTKELQYLASTFKTSTGISIDEYTWRVKA